MVKPELEGVVVLEVSTIRDSDHHSTLCSVIYPVAEFLKSTSLCGLKRIF
jgi:hypothetical protein